MQEHEEKDPSYSDSWNGYKPKTLKSSIGEIPISVPQDCNSDFEPARGMSVSQISEQIWDIYGFEVSEFLL